MDKQTYAIVGTGARHAMFRRTLTETYADSRALVGLCDVNSNRLALAADAVPGPGGNGIATYASDEFDRMLAEQNPGTVIVTVPDDLHERYIVAAMRAGRDVLTEKPMTTDLPMLKRILDAQAETGRKVTVTFNYRYTPARTQLKDILMSGAIGTVTAVDFNWYLDRVHGADYFRRWHRDKARSGGLLVHKATHHFDLINWWLDAHPAEVSARGRLDMYTPRMAAELGLEDHGTRCQGCPVATRCPFFLDISTDPALDALYLQSESLDGYVRDGCVFSPEISIEDLMQVNVRYDSGALLNYSLCAYSPWEGLEIKFRGTKGDLFHRHVEVHGVFGGRRDKAVGDNMATELHLAGEPPCRIEPWRGEGDHGGADPIMLAQLFDPDAEADRYNRGSTHVDGAWSILTGIAANSAMELGSTVGIDVMLAEAEITLPR